MGKRIISVEISDELKEALRIIAFKQKLTVSAVIRNTLEAVYVKELEAVKADMSKNED